MSEKTVRVMVFVLKEDAWSEGQHEWHSYPDGTVLMGRPSIGFHMESGTTHRQLHANPLIKFKELRDVPAI